MKEADFPALFVATDKASNNSQKTFLALYGFNLVCLSGSALLSVLNFPSSDFAVFQGTVLILGLVSTAALALFKPQETWYGNRALAESIKTISWRYMMRAEPYDIDDASSRSHFLSNLKKLFNTNRSFSSKAIPDPNLSELTPQMEHVRGLSLKERIGLYSSDRINNQLDWYIRKAAFNKKRSYIWYFLVALAYVCAIIFSFLKVEHPDADFWPTDFFVTAAGGLLAWVQTKRFQELTASYSLTAHEIGLLLAELPVHGTDKDFSEYVGDAENAFSREHTQWQARRDRD